MSTLSKLFVSGESRRIEAAYDAVQRGRAAVEGVIGLPHVLSSEVLHRRYGDGVIPSSEEFTKTGINGEWLLPLTDKEVSVTVKGDDTGRLVLGIVRGEGEFMGLLVYTQWDRFAPVSEWQITLTEEHGALAEKLYERLLQ